MEFLNGIFSPGFLRLEIVSSFLPLFSVLQNAIHE